MFDNGRSAQFVRLSADSAVQRTRAISDDATLYLDAPHEIVAAVAGLAGGDARTGIGYASEHAGRTTTARATSSSS